jgi:pimeloyl-ACP methyl ester carboxylesterase
MGQLAFVERGDGPAVVFLHGLAGFKEIWDEVTLDVVAAGFRVVQVDLRGHGASEDVAPPWSIADMADDLERLLDQLGIGQACLVGHSMGGRVLFSFALSRPGRVWGVVPVGAHSQAPVPPYREVLEEVRDAAREGLDAFRAAFERAGEIPERVFRDADFAGRYDAALARNRPAMLVAALDAILAMPVLTPRLGEIDVPALAVVGERDGPFRELADLYARRMPRCRTVVVPDCHHYPMMDAPAAFSTALLAFLRGTTSQAAV